MSITITNETGITSDVEILDDNGTDLVRRTAIEKLHVDFGKYGDEVKAVITFGLVKVKLRAGVVEWRVSDPSADVKEDKWVAVAEIVTKDNRSFYYKSDGTVEITELPKI